MTLKFAVLFPAVVIIQLTLAKHLKPCHRFKVSGNFDHLFYHKQHGYGTDTALVVSHLPSELN